MKLASGTPIGTDVFAPHSKLLAWIRSQWPLESQLHPGSSLVNHIDLSFELSTVALTR
jgi:hypothetical protein